MIRLVFGVLLSLAGLAVMAFFALMIVVFVAKPPDEGYVAVLVVIVLCGIVGIAMLVGGSCLTWFGLKSAKESRANSKPLAVNNEEESAGPLPFDRRGHQEVHDDLVTATACDLVGEADKPTSIGVTSTEIKADGGEYPWMRLGKDVKATGIVLEEALAREFGKPERVIALERGRPTGIAWMFLVIPMFLIGILTCGPLLAIPSIPFFIYIVAVEWRDAKRLGYNPIWGLVAVIFLPIFSLGGCTGAMMTAWLLCLPPIPPLQEFVVARTANRYVLSRMRFRFTVPRVRAVEIAPINAAYLDVLPNRKRRPILRFGSPNSIIDIKTFPKYGLGANCSADVQANLDLLIQKAASS